MPYRTPTIFDFQRNLDMLIHSGEREARAENARLISEFAARGMSLSTPLIGAAIGCFDKIHETILGRAMELIHDFVSRHTEATLPEMAAITRSRFENFAVMLLGTVPPAGFPEAAMQMRSRYSPVLQQRLEVALLDIETGFIGGHSVMTESQKSQSKALRLLRGVYDHTRSGSEPIVVAELSGAAGLTAAEVQAAWRYLRDSGLIETFSIPGTARINAAGINAIEVAQSHPDQPIQGFPQITYNTVNNTANIGTAINSPVQLAGAQSTQDIHTVVYQSHDLAKLADEFSRLREALLAQAQSAEHYAAIGVIASAELETRSGEQPKVSALGSAGRWVFDTATKIGVPLATSLLKVHCGLPP